MATGKVSNDLAVLKQQVGVYSVQTAMNPSGNISFLLEPYCSYLIFAVSGSSNFQGLWVAVGFSSGSQVMTIQSGSSISVSASGLTVTFTQGTRNTRYTVIKFAYIED